jgi:hypothetical protein
MSAVGQKLKMTPRQLVSACHPITDTRERGLQVSIVPGPDIQQTTDTSRATQSDLLQSVAIQHRTAAPTVSAYVRLDVLHDGQS